MEDNMSIRIQKQFICFPDPALKAALLRRLERRSAFTKRLAARLKGHKSGGRRR